MAEDAEILARLQRLEDREAIRTVLHGIARGVDRFDGVLLAECIHEDALLDMGGETAVGGAAFARALRPPAEARPGRMHFVTNERIEIEGDVAASESYILSVQDVMVTGVRQTRVRAGRYLDRFERRAGTWKLSRRTFVDEWGRLDPVGELAPQGRHLGRPAPLDLSYELRPSAGG